MCHIVVSAPAPTPPQFNHQHNHPSQPQRNNDQLRTPRKKSSACYPGVANFQELIAGPTPPCSLDVFSTYWKTREVYEVINFTLSSVGCSFYRTCLGNSSGMVNRLNALAYLHMSCVSRSSSDFMALFSTLYPLIDNEAAASHWNRSRGGGGQCQPE